MKKIFYTVFALLFISSSLIQAQKRLPREVRKNYEQLSYVKATEQMLGLVSKGIKTKEICEHLGDAYYFNNQMEEASQWYEELTSNYTVSDAEYYFRYAMSLKSIKQYEKATIWMDKFSESNPTDKRAIFYKANPDYLQTIKKESRKFHYVLDNLALNSAYSDFGASIYKGGIVFASSKTQSKELYNWNNQPFLDLFYSENYKTSTPLSGAINTKYHESSTAFTKDGKTMYFTRNNYYKGIRRNSKKNINGLKIFKATLEDGLWTNIVSLPINSDEYSVAHPALSVDEKYLYFSSDMPGTKGLSDIFRVTIGEDGTYGDPENLGDTVNTEGRENFPFISNQNILYFSSDGHIGLGGLDVFQIDLQSANSVVKNVGSPINSSKDDFRYVVDAQDQTGFITSNREGGKGDDDIYKFKKEYRGCKYLVEGVVLNKNTQTPISKVSIKFYDQNNVEQQDLVADQEGKFRLQLDNCDKISYRIESFKGGYNQSTMQVTFEGEKEKEQVTIYLSPHATAYQEGTDIAKELKLQPIYFDFDKSYIRADAAIELDKVVDYLKQFPSVHIDVRSHTDSRGTIEYNKDLSERRNQSTIAYLIAQGISKNRLTGKGYGESQLVNRCADGISCTDEEHQLNRRSEFIIIKK